MSKTRWRLLWIAMVALLLGGCSMHTLDDLYALPIRSEKYTNLQSIIQKAMNGMDYSAPLTGENQQTIQSADLNGDGEPEYLLFAKDSSDKPLHIFVFSGDGKEYKLLDTIDCTGSEFDAVEYIQMDHEPGYEIVIGRKVSNQVVGSVSVYRLFGEEMVQVLTADYTEFLTCDLDQNGSSELFILRPGESGKGVAVLYSFDGKLLERSQEVNMSEPADHIKRIMVSKIDGGSPAIYVASAVTGSDGIITDVYVKEADQLRNVSFSNESGTSVQTLRNYYVYADDLDGDGVLELPSLITVHKPTEIEGSVSPYTIRWYAMTADGFEVDKVHTYHNFADGWYLELDAQLAKFFVVTQMGNCYEFYLWDENFVSTEKVFAIYALTGQKREEQAVTGNRFVLYQGESTIYAAELLVASAGYGMTRDSLIHAFHLIQEDWKTGET